jgi:hypothetical protein
MGWETMKTNLWRLSSTAYRVRTKDQEPMPERSVVLHSDTIAWINDNVLEVTGRLVGPHGSSVTLSINPDAINKKLIIRELNREIEGWTPKSTTEGT